MRKSLANTAINGMVALLGIIITTVSCRVFEPDELARELKELRVSEWEIPTLVCVAYNASKLDTNHTSTLRMSNIRHTMVYEGLFGFPKEWLEKCDLTREQVQDDNIENDVNCLLTFLQTTDRRSALHHLTSAEIDLDKCLDWWDQLPPTLNFPSSTEHPPNHFDLCTSSRSDYMLTVSLYILDAILILIAYLVYCLIQVQRRGNMETISNFPLV